MKHKQVYKKGDWVICKAGFNNNDADEFENSEWNGKCGGAGYKPYRCFQIADMMMDHVMGNEEQFMVYWPPNAAKGIYGQALKKIDKELGVQIANINKELNSRIKKKQ